MCDSSAQVPSPGQAVMSRLSVRGAVAGHVRWVELAP